MKFLKKLGAAALAFVMIPAAFTGCFEKDLSAKSVADDPVKAVVDAAEKTADAVNSKFDYLNGAFESLSESGTYDFTVKVPDAADIALSAVSNKDGAFSGKIGLSFMGLTADASVWGNKTDLAVSSEAFLGDGVYGVNLENLSEDLKNTSLYDRFSYAGIDIDSFIDSSNAENGVVANISGALESFVGAVKESAAKLDAAASDGTYSINGSDVSAVVIDFGITEDAISGMTDALSGLCDSIDSMKVIPENFDLGSIKDDILNAAKDPTTKAVLIDGTKIKAYLNPSSGTIMAVDFLISGNPAGSTDECTVKVIFGENAAEALDFSVNVELKSDDYEEGETLNLEVIRLKEITDEGKSGFDLTLKDYEDEINVKLEINDADGAYKLNVDSKAGDTTLQVSGNMSASSDGFALTVDSFEANGIDTGLTLSLTAKAGGTVEEVPEYTNVLTLDESGAEELSEKIENSLLGSLIFTAGNSADVYSDILPEY